MKKASVALAIPLLCLVGLLVWARSAKPATQLGVTDGRLAECPDSPNCVSSQATGDVHGIAPFSFDGDSADAMARLRGLVAANPRATIVTESETYLYAEYRTKLIGYIDDVEFFVDPPGRVIHVRSASRVGHSDLGANRNRVESIRAAFIELVSIPGS